MDQKKIGAFIAQCRKEKKLTQMQLAEILNITNQAVSKWENGKGLPDVSLLEPLCTALDISLNELFSGEHISPEDYKGKAEENISDLFKEKQLAKLKPVKYVLEIFAKVTLFVSLVELVVGIVGNLFNPTILEPMLINVFVWMVLFLISYSKLVYNKQRLKKLKNFGVCVDSKIKEIIPTVWVRIGSYTSCKIICSFVYDGKEYEAVSNYFALTPFQRKEDLYANVYVDNHDPSKYGIELFQIDE